jgi:hypothetical protein
MFGARLQVRPVPSGSTFRAFTMPSSITIENLPERGDRPGDINLMRQDQGPMEDPQRPSHCTSLAGGSQRGAPRNHLVTDLSPRGKVEKYIRNLQNRTRSTPHTTYPSKS